MRSRSLLISMFLLVFMAVGGAVHASGGRGAPANAERQLEGDNQTAEDSRWGGGGVETIKLFGLQEPDEVSLITPPGEVFTGEAPEAPPPSPGDVVVFRERLFALDDRDPENPRPTGEQIGTVVAQCTIVAVGEEDAPQDTSVICSRVFTLDGRGEIAASEAYTFADPLSDTLPLTGGTGEFMDAGGEIAFDPQEIEGVEFYFNSVYTIRLLHLEDGRGHRG